MSPASASTSSPMRLSSPISPLAPTESGSVRPISPPPALPASGEKALVAAGSPATAAATSSIVPVAVATLRRRRVVRRLCLASYDLLRFAVLTAFDPLRRYERHPTLVPGCGRSLSVRRLPPSHEPS